MVIHRYENIHDSFGASNDKHVTLLCCAASDDLDQCKTLFSERDNHLYTYKSSLCKSHIDFIFVKHHYNKAVKDFKVVPK